MLLPTPKRPRVDRDEDGPATTDQESFRSDKVGQIATTSLHERDSVDHSVRVPFPSFVEPVSGSASGCAGDTNRARHSGSVGSDDSVNSGSQSNSPQHQENDDAVDYPDSNDDMDNLSELSNLSGLSEEAWQPVAGPISWVQRQMVMGQDPRVILQELIPPDTDIPEDYDQLKLWKIIINLLSEPPPREKLPNINTLEDVVQLMRDCNKIIVLTGAGVSVSCGIPDFRSRDGIYARLAKDFPNLPDPQAMFDIDFFQSDQRPFFKFAKEIYPGQFEPSLCHKFIRLLETQGKLLRNYTQNIDTLEKVAGVHRVIECHGSFATATCMVCKYKVDAEELRKDIFDQVIPRCPRCPPEAPLAVMKPDIVFFGESLPGEFHRQMAADKNECDLLIVIGSSLKVRPVALIPNSLPGNVPQIIINREPLTKRLTFDVELLGNCDDIISELCKRLGDTWDHLALAGPPAQQVLLSDLPDPRHQIGCPEFHPEDTGAVSHIKKEDRKLRGDLLEHNADSGLGDVETVSSTEVLRSYNSKGFSRSGSSSVSSDDRYERLSSSDSGVEPSTCIVPSQREPSLTDVSSACTSCGEGSTPHDSDRINVQGVSNGAGCSEAMSSGLSVDEAANRRTESGTCSNKDSRHCESERAKHPAHHHSEPDSTSEGHTPRKRTHSHMSDGGETKMNLDRESQKDNAHCSHTDTIEEMRRMWIPRRRLSMSTRIDENCFLFVPPNRYIFRGAEVYPDDSGSDSDESGDESLPSTPSQIGDTDTPPVTDNNLEDEEQADVSHVTNHENLAQQPCDNVPLPSEVSSSSSSLE